MGGIYPLSAYRAGVDLQTMSPPIQQCSICGHRSFISEPVLWESLINEWDLSAEQAAYVNRQQGTRCAKCHCSLRSIALGKAVTRAFGQTGSFTGFLSSPRTWFRSVLELNGAGGLERYLKRLPRRTLGTFPEVDMQKLPYKDLSFDLVLHSDTLEHVPDPNQALCECLRVLKPGGWCCFTVPIITGRMTRNRANLPPSYHGKVTTDADDFLVHTEYGSDCWEQVFLAGFDECHIVTVEFPTAQAIAARKPC